MALPGTAMAHEVVDSGYTMEKDNKCVATDSAVSEGGHGGGETRGHVLATKQYTSPSFGIVACARDWLRPTGYLAVQPDLWYWDGSQVVFCAGLDYSYNSASSSTHGQRIGHQTPCDATWYGAWTYGGTLFNNAWEGGRIWSGYHWLG